MITRQLLVIVLLTVAEGIGAYFLALLVVSMTGVPQYKIAGFNIPLALATFLVLTLFGFIPQRK